MSLLKEEMKILTRSGNYLILDKKIKEIFISCFLVPRFPFSLFPLPFPLIYFVPYLFILIFRFSYTPTQTCF